MKETQSMQIERCDIKDMRVIMPIQHGDRRGIFMELYNQQVLADAGVNDQFVQDNISTSMKGVLRGVHTQIYFPQSKIVTCLQGEIFDVAVDCREDSPTFGCWQGVVLNEFNKKLVYLPEGIAHGFYTTSNFAMVFFKVSTHYHPGDEIGFHWNDEQIDIKWPLLEQKTVIQADKDTWWTSFNEMMERLNELRNKQ